MTLPASTRMCCSLLIASTFVFATPHIGISQTTQPQPTTQAIVRHKLADVLHTRLVEGMITIDSELNGSIPLEGFNDAAQLSISHNPDGTLSGLDLAVSHTVDDVDVSEYFQFSNIRFVFRREESRPSSFSRTIQLTQLVLPPGARMARPMPRLTLQVWDDTALRGRGLGIRLRADTFEELARYNPDETEQFLRPMLRDLQMEDLIGPADVQAWQVFAKEAPIDPATKARITALVKRLDADSPDDRDTAAKDLKSLGGPAIVVLLTMQKSDLSPEQVTRIETLCGPAKPVTPEQAQSLRKNVPFLLTCLASQSRPLRVAGLTALRETTGTQLVFDVDAAPGARGTALDKIRAEVLTHTAP